MTVNGLNFRTVDPTATMQAALVACSTAAWTSATGVVCRQSDASALDASVVVTVSGLARTAASLFTFDGHRKNAPDVRSRRIAQLIANRKITEFPRDRSQTTTAFPTKRRCLQHLF